MLVTNDLDLDQMYQKAKEALINSKDGIEVDIKDYKTSRSKLQNRFYWANVRDISRFMTDAGCYITLQGVKLTYTQDMVHEINKSNYSINTTTSLKVAEFIEYMESVFSFWLTATNYNWKPTEGVREYVKQNIKEDK